MRQTAPLPQSTGRLMLTMWLSLAEGKNGQQRQSLSQIILAKRVIAASSYF
jgi:hypothetical protein